MTSDKKSARRIKDINVDDHRYKRAGIIPYIQVGNEYFYAMTTFSGNDKISDYGGHREFKADGQYENVIEAAVRELKEESYGVFGNITVEMILDLNCVILDGLMASPEAPSLDILVPINVNPRAVSLEFKRLQGLDSHPECGIMVWVSRDQLQLIYGINIMRYNVFYNGYRPTETYWKYAFALEACINSL